MRRLLRGSSGAKVGRCSRTRKGAQLEAAVCRPLPLRPFPHSPCARRYQHLGPVRDAPAQAPHRPPLARGGCQADHLDQARLGDRVAFVGPKLPKMRAFSSAAMPQPQPGRFFPLAASSRELRLRSAKLLLCLLMPIAMIAAKKGGKKENRRVNGAGRPRLPVRPPARRAACPSLPHPLLPLPCFLFLQVTIADV